MKEPIVFRDEQGQEGCITKRLEVEYEGMWREEIEACVDAIDADDAGNDSGTSTMDVCEELIIDLPKETPVVAVQREDKRRGPGP